MRKSLRSLAELIPSEIRTDLIFDITEVNIRTNDLVEKIGEVYKMFIDPAYNGGCNTCKMNMINSMKLLLPDLIKLEKESNLLDS